MESKKKLDEDIKKLVESKNQLIRDAGNLEEIVKLKGIPIFSPAKVAQIIVWIDSVIKNI